MSILTCYVAFCESDAQRVEGSGIIAPDLFGRAVPLKLSQEAAVLAALGGKEVQAMKAAVAPTEWFVAEVGWNADQVAQLFLEKKICHASDRNGLAFFLFHGPLHIREAATFQWRKLDLAATGLEAWADAHLHRFFFMISGACADCPGENRMVWRGTGGSQSPWWCLPCWHSFLTSVGPANLQQAREKRLSLKQPCADGVDMDLKQASDEKQPCADGVDMELAP
jgi:hypothetical protein